ncbi:MAG: hypothetical protein ABIP45_13390 [Knoellia sp.]
MTMPDDTSDPTGMRALLRGLPDPGPMPEDLVQRIQASLASLPPLEGIDGLDGVDAGDAGTDAGFGVSRGTSDSARPSWWSRYAGRAAVAAVVLVGGGAVVATNPLGLRVGASDSAGSSVATQSSAGDTKGFSGPQSRTEADSSRSTTGESVTAGPVDVRHTGRGYTAAGLSTQAQAMEHGVTTTPLTAESPGIGPIGTEIGVRSCLTALDLPRDAAADVDLASLDGTPAAVIVVTLGGARTAYAVGRDCTTGHPALLAGPVTLP